MLLRIISIKVTFRESEDSESVKWGSIHYEK